MGKTATNTASNETKANQQPRQITQAQRIVNHHVLWSLGAGAIPLPVLDVLAVTGIQLDMMIALCHHFKRPFSEQWAKTIISSMSGSIAARYAASYIKFIPVVGSLIGGASMAIMSATSAYALGQVFITYLSAGKDLEDIDLEEAKVQYEKELEKGKVYVERLKSKEGQKIEQLQKLQELHSNKVITKEEFGKLKKSIMVNV